MPAALQCLWDTLLKVIRLITVRDQKGWSLIAYVKRQEDDGSYPKPVHEVDHFIGSEEGGFHGKDEKVDDQKANPPDRVQATQQETITPDLQSSLIRLIHHETASHCSPQMQTGFSQKVLSRF